jgi:hypothetical protein
VTDAIRVDRWSYDQLRRFAERYLSEAHPSGTIPIPIEDLVDIRHKIDVVPMAALREWEVDAFTSRDCQTIYVDQGIYNHSSPNRFRFSLAHELSHILLHKKVFEAATFTDVREWKAFVEAIPAEQYQWIEWQAYALGGLLLVPPQALEEQFDRIAVELENHGVDVRTLTSPGYAHIAKLLGDVFAVSSIVIDKRAVKDGLWQGDAILGPDE